MLGSFYIFVFIAISVKKPGFLNSDSVCYHSYDSSPILFEQNHLYSSIWQYKQERGLFVSQDVAVPLRMLLILAGDIELCPGPNKATCKDCLKTIRRNQRQGECERCNSVLHLRCLIDSTKNHVENLICRGCVDMPMENPADDLSAVNYGHLNDFLRCRGMKLLHQKINGLYSKIDQLRAMFEGTKKNIHILGITESHANKHLLDDQVSVTDYSLVRKDRESGQEGGVCCYIRNDINWQRRTDLEIDGIECLWIEILIQNAKSFLFGIIYRPPDSSLHIDKDFAVKFSDIIESTVSENKEVILCGDLNCNYLVPSDHKPIKDIISLNGFKQIIDQPTRITQSSETLIGIFATTHELNLTKNITYASSLSDHELIGIVRNINCRKFAPRRIQCRSFKNINTINFRNDIRDTLGSQSCIEFLKSNDLNTAWNKFKSLIIAVIDKHAPLMERSVRGRDCPWLTSEIKHKIRERDYYLGKPENQALRTLVHGQLIDGYVTR